MTERDFSQRPYKEASDLTNIPKLGAASKESDADGKHAAVELL